MFYHIVWKSGEIGESLTAHIDGNENLIDLLMKVLWWEEEV